MPLKGISVVWAEEQTGGHGQFGRSWISSHGNLTATYCFAVPFGWEGVKECALQVAKSVASVLRKRGMELEFKWPNDLLVGEKKLCGVLCETEQIGDHWMVVAGVGLNVNATEEELAKVGQPATSLKIEGIEASVEELVDEIAEQLEIDLDVFLPRM